MVGSLHTEGDKSGPVNPDGLLQMLWQKRATSAECKTIRIAASSVMDGWKGHTVPLSDIFKVLSDLKIEFVLTTTGVVGMTLMFPLELS